MEEIKLGIYAFGVGRMPEAAPDGEKLSLQRLCLICGGEGTYGRTNEEKRFEADKIYLFPSGFNGRIISSGDNPVSAVYFDFFTVPPIVSKEPAVYSVREGSPLKILSYDIKSLVAEIGPERSDKVNETVKKCLFHLLSELSREGKVPYLKDEVINSAIDYIRSNYQNNLSVEKLAKKMNFERHYFIRRFRDAVNETPYAYIKSCRIMMAKEYLARGSSYDEAAEKVGYKNGKTLWNLMHKK